MDGTLRRSNLRWLLLLAGMILLPDILLAQQDEEATTFPLENFYAKRKKNPRSILKNVRFGLSFGYGNTFFSHKLQGYGISQEPDSIPRIWVANGPTNIRYLNWVNQMRLNPNTAVGPGTFLVSSDTTTIGFKGNALNIPFKATIHYEWQGRYRIGGGYSYESMSIGSLHSISYGDKISNFQPPASTGWMNKYFGLIGVSFYRLGDYLFTGDAQIGGFNPGSNFNETLIQKGVYVNVGVMAERELSEYLRVFVRPSFEIKNYTMTPAEGGSGIVHNINAFYLNVGLSYSIPELRKCVIPDCKIQMNHAHGDREYRSRVHPIYKRQNPQYGQNHPNLIKYKRKNKRKLNPY